MTIKPTSLHYFRFNVSGSGKLSLEELKMMMEKLGAPQTHLGLKAMIQVRCSFNFKILLHCKTMIFER